MNKKFNNLITKRFKTKNREKRKFLLAGLINVLITNIFLQIFLFSNLFNITISTFLSQFINMSLGYVIYSKFIFNVEKIIKFNFLIKYLLLMLFLWLVNNYGIKFISTLGISNNLSAFFLVPVLAIISFIIQKLWVFK